MDQIVDMRRHDGLFGHPSESPMAVPNTAKWWISQPRAECHKGQGTRDKRLRHVWRDG